MAQKRLFALVSVAVLMVVLLTACGKPAPAVSDTDSVTESQAPADEEFVDGEDEESADSSAEESDEDSVTEKTTKGGKKVTTEKKTTAKTKATRSTTTKKTTTKTKAASVDPNTIDLSGKPIIACWGDSLTEGMAMRAGKSYPARLNAMVGDGYRVLNGGDGGETSLTIMARQGALQLKTAKKITFKAGKSTVSIGDEDDNGFHAADGSTINLTADLGYQIPINNVTIGGVSYAIRLENFTWSPISYSFTLARLDDAHDTLTIPAGTEVVFNNANVGQDCYCDIYLVGANGGYKGNPQTLLEQYQQMADHHKNGKYLVIAPFWKNFDKSFREAFGDHVVFFREEAVKNGLAYEGITPTADDQECIKNNEVPMSLRYKGTVHLNAEGYDFLAHLLYERGKSLGYWK